MKEINVNSMEYRKLSKEDKLKVVKTKIKDILESKDTKVVQEYYKGKKVNVPKDKIGIFKDLCEREKSLEKYVTLEEETTLEEYTNNDTKKVEVVSDNTNKNTNINNMTLEEVEKRIKYIKKYLYEMSQLYKKEEYKGVTITKVEGYDKEAVYIPYNKLGDYKTLVKYLRLLEMKKRQLEATEVKPTIKEDKKVEYSYLTEDENPYETGYAQFAGNYNSKPSVNETNNNVISNDKSKEEPPKKPVEDKKETKEDNKNKELMVLNNSNNKSKKKKSFGKKLLGAFLGLSLVKKVTNSTKKITNKVKSVWSKAKEKVTKNSKPENLRDKSRKNRLKVKICAFALAATALVCGFLPKGNNSKKNNDTSKPVSSVIDTTNNEVKDNDIILEEPTEKVDVPTEKIEEPVVEEEKDYSLGDTINIEDNAYIYTNSYDATDQTNYYTPYYNGTYDREVLGVTYELDGNLYTIYKYDANASNKINELINKGAKQTAVLVVRTDLSYTNDYEGYYNVDSVKRVKTK